MPTFASGGQYDTVAETNKKEYSGSLHKHTYDLTLGDSLTRRLFHIFLFFCRVGGHRWGGVSNPDFQGAVYPHFLKYFLGFIFSNAIKMDIKSAQIFCYLRIEAVPCSSSTT